MSTVEALRCPVSARPLFRFLVHFADDSDAVTHDQLWAWIDSTAPSWDVDIGELRVLKMELGRSAILLRLKPDLLGDGLLLTGWSYEGTDGRQSVAADGPCDDERLSAEISRLVQHVDLERDPVLPVIEFLVPVAMLDYRCDAIEVRIRGQDHSIGATFPVVVRPLDRAADAAGHEFQKEAWATIKARCGAYDADAICWVEEPQAPVKLAPRVCAALAYARPSGPADDPAFMAVLAAGIPVALWHRDSGRRLDPRAALEEVLRSRALQKLPDVVRSQRSSAGHAGASPDHAGNDLVLLWDDPHRIPQERAWHPPAKDGDTG